MTLTLYKVFWHTAGKTLREDFGKPSGLRRFVPGDPRCYLVLARTAEDALAAFMTYRMGDSWLTHCISGSNSGLTDVVPYEPGADEHNLLLSGGVPVDGDIEIQWLPHHQQEWLRYQDPNWMYPTKPSKPREAP